MHDIEVAKWHWREQHHVLHFGDGEPSYTITPLPKGMMEGFDSPAGTWKTSPTVGKARRKRRALKSGKDTETLCLEGSFMENQGIVGNVRVPAGSKCQILSGVTIDGDLIMEGGPSSLSIGADDVHLPPVHVTGDIIVKDFENAPILTYTMP